ncbi:30S ribosomal protein S17e [Candidatus Woesearchaeota archaeon]|nr:30S ribosomal protein S17e [Candidatus Woesearchaeota archaeon]
MGRIKTKLVKRKSRELMNSYGDQMSDDFDQNKAIAEKYMEFPSKKIRNIITGYVTRMKKNQA